MNNQLFFKNSFDGRFLDIQYDFFYVLFAEHSCGLFWRELFILNPPPLAGMAILPEYIHYYGLNPPPPGGTAILREYIHYYG
jgi:hypothetical protein